MNTRVIGITHQNLPSGYQTRPATLGDLAATVATLNAAYEASIGAAPFNADTLTRDWTEPGFNLESDSRLVISPSGQVVG